MQPSAGFEFLILLPFLPKCREWGCVLPHLTEGFISIFETDSFLLSQADLELTMLARGDLELISFFTSKSRDCRQM